MNDEFQVMIFCDSLKEAKSKCKKIIKANFGILPALELEPPRKKRDRAALYSKRAIEDIITFLIEEKELII